MYALNVRTNHGHLAPSANRDGEFLGARLKALASDALYNDARLPWAGSDGRRKWRMEKGNIVEVENVRALEDIVFYICDVQE